MAAPTAADKAAQAKVDPALTSELTPGMQDLLRDRARQYYSARLWKTLCFVMLFGFWVLFQSSPGGGFLPSLTPVERNIAAVMILVILAYLAVSFALVWPERGERELLQKEIEYRRQYGKWRWDR